MKNRKFLFRRAGGGNLAARNLSLVDYVKENLNPKNRGVCLFTANLAENRIFSQSLFDF
jgi:hypothetical protein